MFSTQDSVEIFVTTRKPCWQPEMPGWIQVTIQQNTIIDFESPLNSYLWQYMLILKNISIRKTIDSPAAGQTKAEWPKLMWHSNCFCLFICLTVHCHRATGDLLSIFLVTLVIKISSEYWKNRNHNLWLKFVSIIQDVRGNKHSKASQRLFC